MRKEKRVLEESRDHTNIGSGGPYLTSASGARPFREITNSEYGTRWDYFPHYTARSRAYRWGEDGLGRQFCGPAISGFAASNGTLEWHDPILKDACSGLYRKRRSTARSEGVLLRSRFHPTHSYMMSFTVSSRGLSRTPSAREENRPEEERTEFELIDT